MNRIDKKFNELRKNRKKGFIAYITAGDPTLKITACLIPELEKSGVDLIELGVPFSDPLADGLTNQKAAERALLQGVSVRKILDMVRKVRINTKVPIILFTYLNPVFRYGWLKFAKDASAAGVDGILILDLPAEESDMQREILAAEGIKMIYLVAPTSTEKRIKLICRRASGFIYYVSRTGVTGMRKSVQTSVEPMVKKIKKHTKLPVAVGFGISKPNQVKQIAQYADAVVVGSAIVNQIELNMVKKTLVPKISKFVKTLTKTLQ